MPGKNNGADIRSNVVRAKERRAKALKMRIDGASIPEIRTALEFTNDKKVRTALRRASRESFNQEDKKDAVGLELDRLDVAVRHALKIIQDAGVEPHARMKAVDSLVKVSQRRSSFMGLDARPGEHDDDSAVDLWLAEMTGVDPTQPRKDYGDEDDDELEDDGSEDLADDEDEDAAA